MRRYSIKPEDKEKVEKELEHKGYKAHWDDGYRCYACGVVLEKEISQSEQRVRIETAQKIAMCASFAGLYPKNLASKKDWKEAVKKIEQRVREEYVEIIKGMIPILIKRYLNSSK